MEVGAVIFLGLERGKHTEASPMKLPLWLVVAAERTHLDLTQSVAGSLVRDGVSQQLLVFGMMYVMRGSFSAHDSTCTIGARSVESSPGTENHHERTVESFKSGPNLSPISGSRRGHMGPPAE